ncbi:MAG: LuxR C-terminal-related transcriptional regulator [Ilumatobacteraceae bacterium]
MWDVDRVLVVDDDPFTASLLAESLAALGWVIAGVANDAAGALSVVDDGAMPSVALLDLDLGPGPDGIDLANVLRERNPGIALVLLTAYRTPRLFRPDRYRVPTGMRLVSKAEVRNIALVDAELRAAMAAPLAVNPAVMAPAVTDAGERLTDRQMAILRLVADGLSNAAIAERLGIAEPSVEKAVARLIKRLGVSGERGVNQRVLLARAYDDLARASRWDG